MINIDRLNALSASERPLTFADLKAIRYLVDVNNGDPITLDLASAHDQEKQAWCIRRGASSCLTRDGEFVYEPIPSSRTDDFLALCRFSSPQEALMAFAVFKKSKKWPKHPL